MYAIIEVAGKQYKVIEGLNLYVDRLEAEEGQTLSLDKVLLIKSEEDVQIGMPYVEGASVSALVTTPEVKDKKVIVFKYKRKTGYHKKQGHRQKYTLLKIQGIQSKGSVVTSTEPIETEVPVES
ncbi:MAG: 50S ribosomal protein L21 [Candidatus Margulisiibacteriota bacterium]